MNQAPHVLVIDGTSDTEAVLKAVLEPKGTQVERTRGANLARHTVDAPHIVVIDLDEESASLNASRFEDSHRILIGSARINTDQKDHFLAKPFQYPELLQTIEDLLSMPRAS